MKFDHDAVDVGRHLQTIDLKRVSDLALERELRDHLKACGKERSDGRTLEICLDAPGHKHPCPFTIGRDLGIGIGL